MSTQAPQRPRNKVDFADVIVFIVAFVMFLVGIYLFGAAFSSPVGTEFWVFIAGLLAASLAFLVPVVYHWARDRRS